MNDKIKCVVVDDEPIAREITEGYIKKINFLGLVAVCEDPLEAMKIMEDNPVDLLISDIRMPVINGLELVRSLPAPPVIIFVTAYHRFAVNSYELGVADYLLKPVSFERFLKAINRACLQISIHKSVLSNSNTEIADCIFIKAKDKLNKIMCTDILYIESLKDFIKIITAGQELVTYSSMKAIEEKLPLNQFIRIHNSFLVSVHAVKAVKGNTVELTNGKSLPVSKGHKRAFFAAWQINNINNF